jgi:hydrogenase maturation protein HypF
MRDFEMCCACRAEYDNPADRRFHAQPVACPECGPQLSFWDNSGKTINTRHEALILAVEHIKKGSIVALKGVGGFQLLVDAANDDAITRLRKLKYREEKPFALMFPSINAVKSVCNVSDSEERLLKSPESPIVILQRKTVSQFNTVVISPYAAPDNPYLGIMLASSPLHHLIMQELNAPVIATSGNISEEPICIDEYAALMKLKGIADFYLVHNRPIVRHVDDSIVRVVRDKEMIIRRARGYAPLPIQLRAATGDGKTRNGSIIAVGGHLKNTIAISKNNSVFISQHIGDLSSAEAVLAFEKTVNDFRDMYRIFPERAVTDGHPDYISTKFAEEAFPATQDVQHHIAHVIACYTENALEGEALGVGWDGTGYGLNGRIWGGEFFTIDGNSIKHIAQLREFPLPGGEKAILDCRRTALGLLYEIFGESIFNTYSAHIKKFHSEELSIVQKMLSGGINSPRCSSVGRLFDAVSSITGICDSSTYEGKCAMMLEFSACDNVSESYPFRLTNSNPMMIDWELMIHKILEEIKMKVPAGKIAAKFHNSLAEIILAVTFKTGMQKVVLSGGCFQNFILLNKTIEKLQGNGIEAYWHHRVPTNDGGISFGQIASVHNNINIIPENG